MRRITVVAIAVFAPVLGGSVCVAGPEIDVFIMSGQSNMTGLGNVADLTAPFNAPQPNVDFFWGNAGQDQSPGVPYVTDFGWEPLQPNRGNNGQGFFGPELTLGNTLANALPNEHIAIIKQARSGTTLAQDWNPVNDTQGVKPQWTQFVSQVTTAIQDLQNQGYSPVIKGMFWLQGEDDATNPQFSAAYQTNLQNFIPAVRTALDAPNMPFIVGRIQPNQPSAPGLNEVRTAQVNVAQAEAQMFGNVSPNAFWVNTDDLPVQSDLTHFTSAGQLALGTRFADAYLALPAYANAGLHLEVINLLGPGNVVESTKVVLVNQGPSQSFNIDGYTIASSSGSLNAAGFAGFAAHNVPGWESISPSANALSELNLAGSTTLASGQAQVLGTAFVTGAAEDLTFRFHLVGQDTSTFNNAAVYTSQLAGDVNADGVVNGLDINMIATNWLHQGSLSGDANFDGVVNGLDVNYVAAHWLNTLNGGSAEFPTVPEPSAFALTATAVLFLFSLVPGKGYFRDALAKHVRRPEPT